MKERGSGFSSYLKISKYTIEVERWKKITLKVLSKQPWRKIIERPAPCEPLVACFQKYQKSILAINPLKILYILCLYLF
jgi:hypothetical protein